MLMAPAIVNPDGDTKEDSEDPNFPEMGDLTGTGDAGIMVDGNAASSRPTAGLVTVDAEKRTVSIGQVAGIVPDIGEIPVVKVGDLPSLMRDDNEWLGSHHARVINNKAEEAVVYTNVEAAGPRAWTDHYDGTTARPGTGTDDATRYERRSESRDCR